VSAEAKIIHLDDAVFTALQEAAAREHKTLDEMAGEAGLPTEGLRRVQSVIAKFERVVGDRRLPALPHHQRQEFRRL